MIHRLRDMIGSDDCRTPIGDGTLLEQHWVRAVPLPFYTGVLGRIRDAWAVVRGDAYAVRWPEPGELEDAMDGPWYIRTPNGLQSSTAAAVRSMARRNVA